MARKLKILPYLATAALIGIVMLEAISEENPYSIVTAQIKSLIEAEGVLEIFSLDPNGIRDDENTEDFFRGWKVLGSAIVDNPGDRKRLLSAFVKDIPSRDPYGSAFCFNPRHGIRFKRHDAAIDLLICFSCAKTYYYNLEQLDCFPHRSRSEAGFDAFLISKNVQLAPKERHSETAISKQAGWEIVGTDEFGLPKEPSARSKTR